ncbi:MAG: hypothetical protein GMKNLPBB_00622 [Myxococcota bacterium]|nr:hypothetical protein [Myxococcota bacterium]
MYWLLLPIAVMLGHMSAHAAHADKRGFLSAIGRPALVSTIVLSPLFMVGYQLFPSWSLGYVMNVDEGGTIFALILAAGIPVMSLAGAGIGWVLARSGGLSLGALAVEGLIAVAVIALGSRAVLEVGEYWEFQSNVTVSGFRNPKFVLYFVTANVLVAGSVGYFLRPVLKGKQTVPRAR